jgi:hypothetical protein
MDHRESQADRVQSRVQLANQLHKQVEIAG